MTDLTQRITDLLAGATPGPWEMHTDKPHLDPFTVFGHGGTRPENLTHVASVELGWRKTKDGALIAAAPSLLAECVSRITELEAALADCVVKSTEFGEDADGFVTNYLMPVGPLHRAIPLLDAAGIVVRPGFDGRVSA